MRVCYSIIAAFGLLWLAPWVRSETVLRTPADRQYAFAEGLHQQGLYDLAAGEFAKFAEQFREDPRREAAVFYAAQSLFQSAKEQREAALLALLKYQQEYSGSESKFYGTSFYILGEIYLQKAEEALSRGEPSGKEPLPETARQAYDKALTAYLRCAELCAGRSHGRGAAGGAVAPGAPWPSWPARTATATGPGRRAGEVAATALSRAGYCAGRLQKWQEAVTAYRKLASQYQSVRAQFMAGECFRRWGQTEPQRLSDAMKAYKRVELFGDNSLEDDAAVGMAWCLYKQGKPGECSKYLQKRISEGLFSRVDRDFEQKVSKLPEAYYLLGLCSSQLGDRKAAVSWFRLLSKYPECPFQRVGLARLGQLLGGNVDASTDEGAAISYATGESFMEVGKPSEAAAEFERLYRSYPKIATAAFKDKLLYEWGICYEQLSYYREALAILSYLSHNSPDAAIRAKAARVEALCHRQLAREANDSVDRSREELEAIAALKTYADHTVNQDAEETLESVADFYYARKAYARATAVYEEFLSRFPRSSRRPDILFRLGRCHIETRDRQGAISFFEKCRKEYPSRVQAVFATEQLAALFAGSSQYEAALVEYSRLQPESFPGLSAEEMEDCKKVFENAAYSRGIIRERMGDISGAAAELEVFILQFPNSPKNAPARLHAATLFFDKGQYEDSVRVLRPYLNHPEKCPDLEMVTATLVGSFLKLGRPADAIEHIKTVFKSQAGTALPATAVARLSKIMEKEGEAQGARLPYLLLVDRQRKLYSAMTAAAANARDMVEKEEYNKAVEYCSDIFAIHAPQNASEWKEQVTNREKGTRKTAFACLRSLEEMRTKARSDLRAALWELGELDLRLDDPAAAAETFESLADIKPPTRQHFDVLFEAGSAWKEAGELRRALRDFEDIVRFSSEPADSLRAQLAIGDLWLDSGNASRSLGTYLRIINFYDAKEPQVRPWAARAIFQSGVALQKLGRTGDARRQFEALVRDFAGEKTFAPLVQKAKHRLGQMDSRSKTESVPSW